MTGFDWVGVMDIDRNIGHVVEIKKKGLLIIFVIIHIN